MIKYSFEEIKRFLQISIEEGMAAELRIYLYGKEYMIIIYDDHCSFQRCGYRDGSGEQNYNTLDQLYSAKQVDNIVLAKDWNSIEKLECIEFDILNLW